MTNNNEGVAPLTTFRKKPLSKFGEGFSVLAMAEGTYVKLTKEQAPLQNITPGELNQPIDVVQLHARRCQECGQTLPPTYEPPSDEDWTTGIFGCLEDTDSCCTGLFCPCVLFGYNIESLKEEIPWNNACVCHAVCVEGGMALAAVTAVVHGIDPHTSVLIGEGLLFAWWMCGIYNGMARESLQRKYHLKDSPCDPCMVHCCLHWCALCQEHREMKGHLTDSSSTTTTIVDPPAVQEMTVQVMNQESLAPSTDKDSESSNLEIQPL
ncbi:cell number regulator 6-like [Cornus florida]|uniref:cell number regulator 6-like n=1 Tax=Cornus florida TaxID=4283 RepID=UPI0028980945|nr:cell number regulator 6-like [Cornus florida]